MTIIINSENAKKMASIYEMVDTINHLNSVEEFYGKVDPYTYGLTEVEARLHGWRKEAYKRFLMSGSVVEQAQNIPWGWGRYNPHATKISAILLDGTETQLTWDELCKLYD